jgi:hypothetical protein
VLSFYQAFLFIMVDVQTEIVINKPLHLVHEYAVNPDNAPDWYVNIKSAEWKTPKPLATELQIAFKRLSKLLKGSFR